MYVKKVWLSNFRNYKQGEVVFSEHTNVIYGDNARGKMLIGVLILALLVVVAGILLFTTPRPEEETEPDPSLMETESPILPDDSGNVSLDGEGPTVEPSEEPLETPSETPTPVPRAESIEITYAGSLIDDFSEPRGTRIPLRVRIEPAGVEFSERVVWRSSDTSVFEVVEENTEGTAATVTITGTGSATMATLTVSIDGVEAECVVRVKVG